MRGIGVLIMGLALVALSASMVSGETYVEGYLGNAFTVTSPNPIGFNVNPLYNGPTRAVPEYPRNLSSTLIGGFKLGTWFVKEGFPGVDYPNWMKYFGFYLDLNYHWIDYMAGVGSRRMYFIPSPSPSHQHYKFYGGGSIATISFMVAFRYGFCPTKKVPFGKLQPYVAVGPAIFITSLKPTLMFQPAGGSDIEFFPPTIPHIPLKDHSSCKSIVNLGLSTELGLRYMFTRENGPKDRAISLDISVKYRYTRPSITYDFVILGFTHELRFAPELNLFSIQAGVAYHF